MSWVARALFRLTLRLYPRGFRLRYQEEMIHDFQERGRPAASGEGLGPPLAYWAGAIAAVIPSAARVRVD